MPSIHGSVGLGTRFGRCAASDLGGWVRRPDPTDFERERVKRSVFVIPVLLVTLVTASTNTSADFCTTCNLSGSGNHWVSLPSTTSNLDKVEDLCSVSPNIISVESGTRTSAAGGRRRWGCQTGICERTGDPPSSAIPEPGCGSACFCLDPGDGLIVATSGPVAIPIYHAQDDPVSITLQPGLNAVGITLVSLPYQSSIVTAQDICTRMGLPSLPAANPAKITRVELDLTTSSHDCGAALGFILPGPCENAVEIRLDAPVTYTNPVNPGNPPFPSCDVSPSGGGSAAIPTLSEWGFAVLLFALISAGVFLLHRRRTSSRGQGA